MRCCKEPRRLYAIHNICTINGAKTVFEEHSLRSLLCNLRISLFWWARSFTFCSLLVLCGLPPPGSEPSRLGMCRFISCIRNGTKRKIFAHIRGLMRRRSSDEGSGKSNALEKYRVSGYFRLVSAVFDERASLRWELIYWRGGSGRGRASGVVPKDRDVLITCCRAFHLDFSNFSLKLTNELKFNSTAVTTGFSSSAPMTGPRSSNYTLRCPTWAEKFRRTLVPDKDRW